MSEPTYPYGYARPPNGGPQGMGTMLTWEQMLTKTTVNHLHPEVLRRFHALIELRLRRRRPARRRHRLAGAAQPAAGRVRQAGQLVARVLPGVPADARPRWPSTPCPTSSWDWMQAHCGRYGLRTFRYVNNEPWHVQPVGDLDAVAATPPRCRRCRRGTCPPMPPGPSHPIPATPPSTGVFTVNGYRQEVRQGSTGKMAKMCQQQINLIAGQGVAEDGNFGPQSVAASEERADRARRARRRRVRPADLAGVRERHQGAGRSRRLGLMPVWVYVLIGAMAALLVVLLVVVL